MTNQRSHSEGRAPARSTLWSWGSLGLVALVAVVVVLSRGGGREASLWDFVDFAHEAAVDRREADFFTTIDPALRYGSGGGVAELRRDWRRWADSGIGTAAVTAREATFDDAGADVVLHAVLAAGIRQFATVRVQLRAEDVGGEWTVVQLAWR